MNAGPAGRPLDEGPPSSRAAAARTIAVVGGGFCGVAVAVQLMRRCAPGTSIVLINESGRMARGLAYGTRSPDHVLNVPAGNMSALPEDPDHFLRFCRQHAPQLQSGAFVPRLLYGDYLESLLAGLETQAGPGPQLRRVVGRVVALSPARSGGSDPALIHFADGQVLPAHGVVLAFGHFAPRSPLTPHDEALAGDAYIPDPWRADALATLDRHAPVLLVGAGLTAMDVALALNGQQHRGPIVSVSRHGLAPLPHRASGGWSHGVDDTSLSACLGGSLRQVFAALRAEARTQARAGTDWRELMGALRAKTPQLWAALSEADRARFLRHVRPYWEVLRHRCAPQAHAQHQQLVASGQLERLAGRVESVQRRATGLEVAVRPRGGGPLTWRPAGAIINCTGPATDLRRSRSPLVQQLLNDGLLCADRFGLGLHVDARCRVLGADGAAVAGLHYVGPLLKAVHWEATAVPELREHAAVLAAALGGAAQVGPQEPGVRP